MSYLSDSSRLKKFLQERYLNLPQGEFCQVTYVWIAYCGVDLCSKNQTMDFEPKTIMLLIPVCFMFRGPFLLDPNKLVLCEVLKHTRQPIVKLLITTQILIQIFLSELNHRNCCNKVMEKVKELHPWFGMEQEYTLLGVNGHPLAGPDLASPNHKLYNLNAPLSPAHTKNCKYKDNNISVHTSRRYCLFILSARSSTALNFRARYSITQNFNDSYRRNITTHRPIITPVHCRKGPSGGKDNKRRLIGCQVFSSSYDFSAGVANHGASIRIPYRVAENKCGYFQDRHPAANCGPYVVTCTVACTCMLKEEEELK
uniref:glutamine synthetase n=1 Tax=Cyprinus carpio TaxID=7962 RepID=A0A8C1IN08_CYPCA